MRLLDEISPDDPIVQIALFCLGRESEAQSAVLSGDYLTQYSKDIKEHGLTAFFLLSLVERDTNDFDESQRANINRYLKNLTAATLKNKNQLVSLCQRLNKNNIEYLISKGAIWAHQYYSDARSRPFTDIDILVSTHDDAFHSILIDLGYDEIPTPPAPLVNAQYTVRSTGGHLIPVDAHIKLTNATLLRPILDTDFVMAQRQNFRLNDVNVPVLTNELALLHSIIHRSAHNADEDRIIWLIDMVMMTRDWDYNHWQEFRSGAYTIGIGRLIDLHINLLIKLNFIDAIELNTLTMSQPKRESLALKLYETKSSYSALSSLRANLKGLEGLGDKWSYTMQMAFPTKAFMREKYGADSSLTLLYAYLKRLLNATK